MVKKLLNDGKMPNPGVCSTGMPAVGPPAKHMLGPSGTAKFDTLRQGSYARDQYSCGSALRAGRSEPAPGPQWTLSDDATPASAPPGAVIVSWADGRARLLPSR